MKRKLLFSILAAVPAALMPLAAQCQAAPSAGERPEVAAKYEVFAGYSYTSLNQVNQSRYGLQGVEISATRNLGKYFGVLADGSYYKYALGTGNPGSPSVQEVFFGPVLHANLYGHFDGFVHVLLGGAHTGGEGMTPNISFAGGAGGGMDYRLTPRLSLRASGDDIAASFSVRNNSAQAGYSPHTTRNSRASFGLVYRF